MFVLVRSGSVGAASHPSPRPDRNLTEARQGSGAPRLDGGALRVTFAPAPVRTRMASTSDIHLPEIKVCGRTRAEDVAGALEAGAEARGLVFHPPSPRSIEPATAAELVAGLPPEILTVAVVVDIEPPAAAELLETTSLRALQLCGPQDPADWRDFQCPLLRRLGVEAAAVQELGKWASTAAGFVLDHPASAGGSGQRVDPEIAADLARRAPCLLAGGLDPENVAAAIRAVRPRGVDASSRLESSPGQKDPTRVRDFVRGALSTFQELNR